MSLLDAALTPGSPTNSLLQKVLGTGPNAGVMQSPFGKMGTPSANVPSEPSAQPTPAVPPPSTASKGPVLTNAAPPKPGLVPTAEVDTDGPAQTSTTVDPYSQASNASGPPPVSRLQRVAQFVSRVAPVVQRSAAYAADAFHNPEPLQNLRQQDQLDREYGLQQQQAAGLAQQRASEQQTADLNRQYLTKQIAGYEDPATKRKNDSENAFSLYQKEHPPTSANPDGSVSINEFDPTMNGGQGGLRPRMITDATGTHPMTMPPIAGFHESGMDGNGNFVVESYSKGGRPIGAAPAPTPASQASPLAPGMTKVDPLTAGQVGPVPDYHSYPGKLSDPQYRRDFADWSKKVNDLKQSQIVAQQAARGAANGNNRPIQILDPSTQQNEVTTFARQESGKGGLLAGSQSGALNVAGKSATFGELDANIGALSRVIPTLDTAGTGEKIAMAASLTPAAGPTGQIAQGIARNQLSPEQRDLVDVIRNWRQGALSVKNIMSGAGLGSDKKVQLLEAEAPNEQDLMGSSAALQQKMQRFNNIYNAIKQEYPQLVTRTAGPAPPLTRPPIPTSRPTGGSKIKREGIDF